MLKKIFIPGWMDTADNHVDFAGLEIWKKKINVHDKIETEYVIGHSLGANFALINWGKNKNTKLILFNPLLPKRNIFHWATRWAGAVHYEGSPLNKKRLATFLHPIISISQCLRLLSVDLTRVIDSVPKENLILVLGKRDKFYYDKKIIDTLKSKNIKIIEVEEAGHNWNEKFNEIIEELTK
jgi:hypothetical protein